MPAPAASIPSVEQDAERAVQDGRNSADDADGTRDNLVLSVFPAPPSEAVPPPVAESRGRFAENAFTSVPADSPASEPASSTSAATRAAMLFPGITIQGGEWKSDSHPAEPTPASPRREESQRSSYALTIASSGNSGGGLKDFLGSSEARAFSPIISTYPRRAPLRRLGSCSTHWQRLLGPQDRSSSRSP